MKRVLSYALFGLGLSCNSWAGYFTGNDLYEWMLVKENSNDSGWQAGLYNGYISGIVDLGYGKLFCLGATVTARQYNAVVTKYLKDHPDKWSNGADSLVVDALKEAFPCK